MLVVCGNFNNYQISINPLAPIWLEGAPCPLFGARMSSILWRLEYAEIVYVGF